MAEKEKEDKTQVVEPQVPESPKKKKYAFLIVVALPVVTFVVALFLFSSLYGVNIMVALASEPVDHSKNVMSASGNAGNEDDAKAPDSSWKELNRQKAELEELRNETIGLMEKREGMVSEEVKSLARLYDGISESQLSNIFDHMDDTLIVKVLPYMKKAKASKVLEQLSPDRAATISRMMISSK